MENALSYLKLIAQDKNTIESFTNHLKSEIEQGGVDNQWLHAILTQLIKKLTEIKELNAANLDVDNIYKEAFGFIFTKKEAGAKYDFTNCNHPKWIELNKKQIDIKENMKTLETTLKTFKEPMTIIDELSGEMVKVNPPIRKSTTIIEVR